MVFIQVFCIFELCNKHIVFAKGNTEKYLSRNIRLQTDFFLSLLKTNTMQNCLECGEKIMGRIDKKFCSDACRNAYNNKQNKDQTNLMRNINNKLRKNFKILSEQNFVENKAKTTRNKLSVAGFDFEYFTNIKTYKNGAQYYFVYDFGYKFLEDDFILVVKKEA